MDNINKGQEKKQGDALRVVYGDVTLGVHGDHFNYIFSYLFGGPESLMINGKEWLYRAPKPTFWRATTDNDRGNGFSLKSAIWLGADMFLKNIGCEIMIDDKKIAKPIAPENNRYSADETAKKVKISYTYETVTVPPARVETSYEVEENGEILVETHYHGTKGLPELPLFGMRFILPTTALLYRYEGLSGETYPDRMAGGKPGVYEISGLPITRYLVPQDCNLHMDTKWLEIQRSTVKNNSDTDQTPFTLRFAGTENNFAFSCIPYTAEELENATHQEELPLPRRTVVSILGAVRGVGGIDSWGSDVEPPYRISAEKEIHLSFQLMF